MSDAYVPQQFTEGLQTQELPEAAQLKEQGTTAGVERAYAINTKGSNPAGSAVMDRTREQAKANVDALSTFIADYDLDVTDKDAIQTYATASTLKEFKEWVDARVKDYNNSNKDGNMAQAKRAANIIAATRAYLEWLLADSSRQNGLTNVTDLAAKYSYVNEGHIFKLHDANKYDHDRYDADMAKHYGYDKLNDVQVTIDSLIDTTSPDAQIQSYDAIGRELAKLYMVSVMAYDNNMATDAYNKFMQGYRRAKDRLSLLSSADTAHNFITYCFYSALITEPDASDDDITTAANMKAQGDAIRNNLIAAVRAGPSNARVTDNQGTPPPSDMRVKHIRALGGWLPAMTRR